MSRGKSQDLTTTSYAILGLLALRPWTTYELAKQMERTLSNWWPRARSKLYEEPKKLVALGLAGASKDRVGKRPRTVYSITAKGRRALAAWLKTPGQGPSLESEQLTKLFFADQGTKKDALATLDAAKAWATEEIGVFADASRAYLAGEGPFPERVATNMIVGRFMLDFYTLVYRWAEWGSEAVAAWPDDPSEAEPDWTVMEEIVRRGDEVHRAGDPTA
jgi:DNA-binding PadR family transcriptional regulator